jgi:hypothetical protein|tara:strand:+ start:172 stop:324 length:153 start_codon:yes stop_codon:yes gene_type:complete
MTAIKTEELQTVRNYAAAQKVTTACVYKWIDKNIIKSVEIDGVKFVKIKP